MTRQPQKIPWSSIVAACLAFASITASLYGITAGERVSDHTRNATIYVGIVLAVASLFLFWIRRASH